MPLLERKNPQGVPKKKWKRKKKNQAHRVTLSIPAPPSIDAIILSHLYSHTNQQRNVIKKKNTMQFIMFRRVLIRGSITMWILQMRELWFRVICLRPGSQYLGFKNQYILNIYIHSYVHTNLRTGTGLSSFYSVR